MQNYTDLFNWRLGEIKARHPEEHAVIWELLLQEGEYRVGNMPYEHRKDHLVLRAELGAVYDELKQAIYRNHEGMYRARIPYAKVDLFYKEAFKRAYIESKGFDFNKTAEYFYHSLAGYGSKN